MAVRLEEKCEGLMHNEAWRGKVRVSSNKENEYANTFIFFPIVNIAVSNTTNF